MNDVMRAAAERLKPLIGRNCETGLILGSGLGNYAERLKNTRTLNYADIPGFPQSSVPGHKGRFVIGEIFGKTVIAMQGRFHFYEGYAPEMLALGVRTMHAVGVKKLLLTNAAGGVNESFDPGDIMLISDHINFARCNPLIGPNDETVGVRFPDQSNVYDRTLRTEVKKLAEDHGITLREGIYMMFSGPTFETPAEIRMARILGASAVGMSTVPEAIAASHCGMKLLGISLITNMAAGILDQPLTHEEVQETAAIASERFTKLVDLILESVL